MAPRRRPPKGQRSCPSGKMRYPDHMTAARKLSSARMHSTRERVPARAYECDMCKGWHLTSRAH